MSTTRIAVALVGLALATNGLLCAQSNPAPGTNNRIYGYVNLLTGLFHPAASEMPDATTSVPLKTFTGTLEMSMTIALSPTAQKAMPKGSTIQCSLTVGASIDEYGHTEVAQSTATVNGDKATCTVTMAYSWTGNGTGPATAYSFSGTYQVTATYASGGPSQPLTQFNVIRQTNGAILNSQNNLFWPIPRNGTVTEFSVDATL